MKTTTKQFKIFQKECEKWIKEFGMLGFGYYYDHTDVEGLGDGVIGSCTFPESYTERDFTITLSENVEDSITEENIRETAFHEVMECFLYRIRTFAYLRFINARQIDDEIHNIIMTLEKVVFNRGK